MSGDYQLIVVIGYELASYLLFYSSARCVTLKELFICKNSIFVGDTKINPLFLFFLPPDNFTVEAVWSVETPSPCRSSTTVFRLSHKQRKGLHVTSKPCLDWWHEIHFFCAHAKRCFYGDFSVLPFLAVPFSENGNRVWPPAQQVGQAVTHGRQTGKNAHIFPPEGIQPLRNVHTSLVWFAIPRFQTSPFFFSYGF